MADATTLAASGEIERSKNVPIRQDLPSLVVFASTLSRYSSRKKQDAYIYYYKKCCNALRRGTSLRRKYRIARVAASQFARQLVSKNDISSSFITSSVLCRS